MRIISPTGQDDATTRAQPCPASVKEEEVQPKYLNRPELKEKANCPDCCKELTIHCLKYTHKKVCKANQPDVVGEAPTQMPKLERILTNDVLGGAQTEIGTANFVPITSLVPTDEQIAAFILNQRNMKANEKREKMSSLVSRALPK